MQLYDLMIGALREHWAAHDKAYPQHFSLTRLAHDELLATRKLVTDTMNFRLPEGWQASFMGVKVVVGDSNHLVSKDGAVVQLG